MLYYKLLKQSQTVTAPYYAGQLQKLAEAVRGEQPRQTFVHLLHDNARSHIGKETRAKLEKLGWDTILYPP